MRYVIYIFALVIITLLFLSPVTAQDEKRTVFFDDFDFLDMITTDSGIVWNGWGRGWFRIDSTWIYSDSVVWLQDQNIIHFFGGVEAYDSTQHIWADKVSYYHADSVLIARENAVLIHNIDSIRAEAHYIEYDIANKIIVLENDPWLFLNYPDYNNLVTISGEYLTYFSDDQIGMAEENVQIDHSGTKANCGCAEFYKDANLLSLMDKPVATRDSSIISGNYMNIFFKSQAVDRIEVSDSASAYFVEQSDSTTGEFSGSSTLTGRDITFFFKDNDVRKIAANGAARSEYLPSPDDTTGSGKNIVSGDSIFIYIKDRKIMKAEVKGGAEGIYITEKETAPIDSSDVASITASDTLTEQPCDTCYTLLTTEDNFDNRYSDNNLALDDSLDISSENIIAEDSIHYRGAFLEFFSNERIIGITTDAMVRQGTVLLTADKVNYNIPDRIITADALVDSTDSIPSIVPLSLKDGGEEIFGSKLVFNVDTKKGLIENSNTRFEKTQYRGDDLYKEDEKIFYVENGILIPCDKEAAYFHFRSRKMKIIQDDRVIARPVRLYLYKLPIAYIPYYVFPLKRGRHSGILPIKLGNFEKGNRFIGNIGYYWASSEYWDIEGSLDFYENIGITINGLFRYNKRYEYSGYVRSTFARESRELAFTERQSRRWTISGSHSQTLPYDIKFGASGTFVSDESYYSDYSTNPDERRNRNIRSQANFSKRFGRSSLSLSFNHQDNLDTDSRSSNLPSGRFSISSFHPFGSGREEGGKTIKSWYNYLRLSYSNNFGYHSSGRTLHHNVIDTTIIDVDSLIFSSRDSTSTTNKKYSFIDHSMSLNASQKLFGYISISPRVSFQETWYYIPETDQARNAGIPVNRSYRRGSISAGISTNTNLYGTFPINLFGLQALRHVMTPSVGFNWAPFINKNAPVKSFVGRGGGGSRQMAMSMTLTHLLQAKIKQGEKEKKLDLLRISSSTSYNFEAIGKKFSNLRTGISSSILRKINLSGNLIHDMYDKNDKLIWWRPRLKTFSLNTSFQARGSVSDNYVRSGLSSDRDYAEEMQYDTSSAVPSPYMTGESKESQTGSPVTWNMNFSHNYTESRSITGAVSKTHWAQLTFNLGVTKNWKIKYSQRYDFVKHQTIDKIVDINRSLNCWEGHFYWIPDGSRQGFYFKLYLLAIPDIKVEKSESGLRGALFNR
ncbi:MAG: LPS assembly protein LptD [candidate division Zixibacteria bacterium]